MRKTLTIPLAVAALGLTLGIALTPKPALAEPSPAETVATQMFTAESIEYIECSGDVITVNTGAQFQAGASVNLQNAVVTVNINASELDGPTSSLTFEGGGSLAFNLNGHTVNGSNLVFTITDNVDFSLNGEGAFPGVKVSGGTANIEDATLNKLTVSDTGHVTMTRGTVTQSLIARGDPESSLTINNATVGPNTDFRSGPIVINGIADTIQTSSGAKRPCRVNGADVTLGEGTVNADMTINRGVLDFKGGTVSGDVDIYGGTLKLSDGSNADPVIAGTITLRVEPTVTLQANGGRFISGPITVPEGAAVTATGTTTQDFTVAGGSLSIDEGAVTGAVAVQSGTLDVNVGSSVTVGAVTGGVVNLNGATANFASTDGNTAGEILVTAPSALAGGLHLDGTNLTVKSELRLPQDSKSACLYIDGGTTTISAGGVVVGGNTSKGTAVVDSGATLIVDGGTITHVGEGNVIESHDANVTLNSGMLQGNVRIRGNSALTMTGATIEGKLTVAGTSEASITGGEVTGTFFIQSTPRVTLGSSSASTPGSSGPVFSGDVSITGGTTEILSGTFNGAVNIGSTSSSAESLEVTIGAKSQSATSQASGPTINAPVTVTNATASILGGKLTQGLDVPEPETVKVTIGTAEEGGIPASGPVISGTLPEAVTDHIVINYTEEEPEPTPSPTPTPAPTPTPQTVLTKAAPLIKATMAEYADATYSSDFLYWNVVIEDPNVAQSTLANDLIAEILRVLSTSTVRSAASGENPEVAIVLPTSAAKRLAFAEAVLANAETTAVATLPEEAFAQGPTLGELIGKTCTVVMKTSAGRELILSIAFDSITTPGPEVVTVYRLYNPYLNGAHLFTKDVNEINELTALGWQDEGSRFSEYAEPATDTVAVLRLYNPNNGDHFFTESEREASALESVGWTREGMAWYAPIASELPAYRLYNPYQTEYEGLGNHLWTILENERTELTGLGWLEEGVGWYAMPLMAAN